MFFPAVSPIAVVSNHRQGQSPGPCMLLDMQFIHTGSNR
jgi:hypothetical protein